MRKSLLFSGLVIALTLLCCYALVTADVVHQKKSLATAPSVGKAAPTMEKAGGKFVQTPTGIAAPGYQSDKQKTSSSSGPEPTALRPGVGQGQRGPVSARKPHEAPGNDDNARVMQKKLEAMKSPANHTDGLLDCSNAIPIACGDVVNGDNTSGMMNVQTYNCSGWTETGPEVVYELTLDGEYYVTGSLSNMACDDDIFFLSACDENACLTYGDISFTSGCVGPGTFYIVVDRYSATTGCTYTLTVTCVPCGGGGGEGESCSDAIEIASLPFSDSKNTCDYADDCGNASADVFYHYVVQDPNELLDISLMGSAYDTYLWVWSECCVTYIAYNDDANGTLQSEIYGCFQPGDIWIQVEGYSSNCGMANLSVTSAGPCPEGPPNDHPEDAEELIPNADPTCASNFGATGPDCPEYGFPDVWYYFTLDNSETSWNVAVEWCGTTLSGSLYTYMYTDAYCGGAMAANYYEYTTCVDGLITLHWDHLAPGTYYYPFNTDAVGDYCVRVSAVGTPPGPENDDCENAVTLVVNDPNPTCGTTVSAYGPDCAELYYADVWYTFTLTEECSNIIIWYCGSTISGSLEGYLYKDGCCLNPDGYDLWDWECDDGYCTPHWNHLAAGQYWYPVGCSSPGDFCIRVTAVPCPPPADNDECETARVIGALPYSDTGNTCSANLTCGTYTAPDVFYMYHVPDDMTNGEYLTVSLMGSAYDTYLYVWSECCVTMLAYNDDFGGTLQSQLSGCFHGDIWIEVSGFSTACGDFILNVTSAGECAPAPENDMCDNATPIECPVTDVYVNLQGSTPDCAGIIGNYNNVWYTFYLDPNISPVWDVHIRYCGTDPGIGTIGANMQNDCLCDDYFGYTGFSSTYCEDIYWLPEWIYFDGMPAGQWYLPIYTDIGTYVVFSLTCEPAVPCVVECPAGATQEGEACPPEDVYNDYYNGGCNSVPPVFSPIACGETVCGTGWYDGDVSGYRDTDWYEFTLTEPGHVVWKVVAEFPLMTALMTPQPDCSYFTYIYALVMDCDTATLEQDMPAGTFWCFAAPQFATTFWCDDYVGTLTCGEAPPQNCQPCDEAEFTGPGTPGPDGWTATFEDNTCTWNGAAQNCIWGADYIWSDACGGVQYGTNPKRWYTFTVNCQTTITMNLHPTAGNDPQLALVNCCPTLDGDEDMTQCCVATADVTVGGEDENIVVNVGPGTYWVSVAMWDGCGPYILTITSSDCQLPVNLTTLEGTADDHMVTLTWTTATEQNNARFDVQRKTTTSDWTKVGTVNGAGNSQTATNYRFVDRSVVNGVAYTYRLVSYDLNGTVHEYDKTVEATPAAPIPTEYALYQNYPNPFNPQTSITYAVKDAGFVTLKVYNLIGQEVATLVSAKMEPGRYNATFSANDLPSGVYVYRLEVNNFTAQKKMVLLK
jgi:hypothetical protein